MEKGYYSKYYKTIGVYKITNIVNNKIYIGSSINIAKRWQSHLTNLKHGKHENSYLQNAWNKYGESNFKFEILETIDSSGNSNQDKICIRELEQQYINTYKSYLRDKGYNLASITRNSGWVMNEETIKRGFSKQVNYSQYKQIINLLTNTEIPLNEIAAQIGVSKSLVKSLYEKKICKEDLKQYVFIKRTVSKREKCKEKITYVQELIQAGKTIKYISQKLGMSKTTFKKFCDDNEINTPTQSKKVYQYNVDGSFICEYKSTGEAARINKWQASKIGLACNENKSYKGYRWSYIYYSKMPVSNFEILLGGTKIGKRTPLIRYDLNHIPIQFYSSTKNIDKNIRSNIVKACKDCKNEIIDNSYWKFATDATEEELGLLLKK